MNLSEIKAALIYGQSKSMLGKSLLFKDGILNEKWNEIKVNPFFENLLNEVVIEGEKRISTPINSLLFSDYKIYDTSGSRKEYEKEYFEHRERLNTFAILAMAYEDKKYVDALENAIWAICDEYTWCLPAHLGGKSLIFMEKSEGNVRQHDKQVDLFASETGFALAEIITLLKDKLAPIVVERAKKLIFERILIPFTQIDRMFFWETSTNNWAAVCAGSVGAAAIYLIEESECLAPIILKVCNVLDSFLSGYENDGACTEGLAYWNYGFGFYVYFVDLLNKRTAGKIDLLEGEKIKNIAMFQQVSFLSENNVVSFSDGYYRFNYRPGLTCYLKNRFDEVVIPDVKYSASFTEDHCFRWCHNLRDFIWNDEKLYSNNEKANKAYYLEDAKWFISINTLKNNNISFAAKGGHNDEPHNHNDVGTFILHVNGESILTDTGAGEYTKEYFGPNRYNFICNSSLGHSVPIINRKAQGVGREYKSEIINVKTSDNEDVFELDISKAYDIEGLNKLVRKLSFDKSESGKLLLRDSYSFAIKPEMVTERFVSFNEPKLQDGIIELEGKNGKVKISFDSTILSPSYQKEPFVNHMSKLQDLYCIDLTVINPKEAFEIEIEFEVIM